MATNLFQFNDYKNYLQAVIKSPEAPRGFKKRLAEVAGCQSSYFSAVLHAATHLTPDHACGISDYLQLRPNEAEYFLTLVDLARSGTPRLRGRLEAKLKALRDDNENLAKRVGRRKEISASDGAAFYYSSWMWTAVHVLTSIPQFQTPQKIARKLHLSETCVVQILEGLEQMALVRRESGATRWVHTMESVHVGRDSPLVNLYHNHWRLKAIEHAYERPGVDVHFTSVTAVSVDAFKEIKALILDTIERWSSIAGPSASEEAVCFSLDLFRVGEVG
jgi:uncharacterized protein (TIGR02147 family)